MTNFKLTNLDILVNLFSLNYVYTDTKKNSQIEIDSFYYPEAEVPQQTAPVDRYLEQICNIF